MNERKSEIPGNNFLEKMVEDTTRLFWSKPSILFHGDRGDVVESYSPFHAASDALKATGLDFVTVLGKLITETKLRPNDLDITPYISGDSWEEIFDDLCSSLVASEVIKRDSRVKEERDRRYNEFDN